jgi:ribokinase
LVLQREIPEEINIKASQLAREMGIKTILDMGGEDRSLSKELLSLIDIISPNKTELRRILDKEVNVDDDNDLISALKEMRETSDNKNLTLLLKYGGKGCIYVDENDNIYKQDAFHVDDLPIVDTTGAGILYI